MHQASDQKVQIAHSQRIRRGHQTAQHSAENAEYSAHSRRLYRDDQTALRSAAASKKSNQVPTAAPAPTIQSCVTRSQGKNSA